MRSSAGAGPAVGGVCFLDGLLGDWAVNIEELKQVGEILASLSGSAYDGYLLWVGKEYLEIVFKFVLWGGFWVGFFKAAKFTVNRIMDKAEAEQRLNDMQEEFVKIADILKDDRRVTRAIFPHSNPKAVTETVKQLLEETKGAAK